jgi:hypothetical protein
MRRFLSIILFVFLLGSLSRFGLPWWSLVPITAVAGWLFPIPPARSFAAAFTGGLLLWVIYALIPDMANGSMLSAKVGLLFQGLKSWQVLLVTGVLGGILAGLGALSGRLAHDMYVGRQPNR